MTVPEVQKSERIGSLQDRLSALEEKQAALEVTYTDEWPEVKEAPGVDRQAQRGAEKRSRRKRSAV